MGYQSCRPSTHSKSQYIKCCYSLERLPSTPFLWSFGSCKVGIDSPPTAEGSCRCDHDVIGHEEVTASGAIATGAEYCVYYHCCDFQLRPNIILFAYTDCDLVEHLRRRSCNPPLTHNLPGRWSVYRVTPAANTVTDGWSFHYTHSSFQNVLPGRSSVSAAGAPIRKAAARPTGFRPRHRRCLKQGAAPQEGARCSCTATLSASGNFGLHRTV
jgi:hypothetical protein